MLHEFVPIIDAQSKKSVRVAITYDMGAMPRLGFMANLKIWESSTLEGFQTIATWR